MAGNIYAWSTTAANNDDADTTINWAEGQLPGTVNDSGRAMMAVHAAFLADNNATLTTSGTGAAYTVTSNLTSTLATGVVLRLKMNATNTGACTLNVTPSGGAAFGAKAIRVLGVGGEADPVAGVIQTNGIYNFNYDSAANSAAGAWILTNPAVPDVSRISGYRYSLSAAASTSALTISLLTAAGSTPSATDPVYIQFRSATGTAGTVSPLAVTAATTLVISAGSTLGVTSSTAFRVWVVGFNDAGTFRLGAINCSTSSASATTITQLVGGISSSTAEGGAGAADSAGVIYTNSAVSSKAMAVLGYLEWNSTGLTAGTWTTANLATVQNYESGIKLPGDILQHKSTFSALTVTGLTITTFATASNGLNLAITLSSAANIVVVRYSGNLIIASDGAGATVQLSRGTANNTNLIGSQAQGNVQGGTVSITPYSLEAFDKPNTASSQAYALQAKTSTGSGVNLGNGATESFHVSEVMG